MQLHSPERLIFHNPETETNLQAEATAPNTEKTLRERFRALAVGGMAMLSVLTLQGDAELPDQILLQHHDKEAHDDDTVTVMTANVHSWDGRNGDNFSKFIEVVEDTDVDVVCIQEYVDEGRKTQELYEAGFDVYWAETVHWPAQAPTGNAIISKPPFDNADTFSLPHGETMSPRNAVMGEIATSRGPLSITNTHLSTSHSESALQSRVLYPYIEQRADILCGDFNQTPDLLLDGSLGELASPVFLATSTPTFPSKPNRIPNREIDYVVSSCGEPVVGTLEVKNIDSDHLARIQEIATEGCF